MELLILAAGKIKGRGLRALIDDYLERVGRYTKIREQELKDAEPAELKESFEKALAKLPPGRSYVVALEVEGRELTSHGLAEAIEQRQLAATQRVVFLIGGAYGIPAEVSRAADLRLSLSKMTLPHRLARLFLAEQLYRAFTILRNEPYSH